MQKERDKLCDCEGDCDCEVIEHDVVVEPEPVKTEPTVLGNWGCGCGCS